MNVTQKNSKEAFGWYVFSLATIFHTETSRRKHSHRRLDSIHFFSRYGSVIIPGLLGLSSLGSKLVPYICDIDP